MTNFKELCIIFLIMDKLVDFLKYSVLFCYYKNLFSEKQKMYLELYFEEDYSFSEIAEKYSITRQAIFDNIKRGTKQLDDYEKKLNIYSKELELKEKLEKLKDSFSKNELEKIISELGFDNEY